MTPATRSALLQAMAVHEEFSEILLRAVYKNAGKRYIPKPAPPRIKKNVPKPASLTVPAPTRNSPFISVSTSVPLLERNEIEAWCKKLNISVGSFIGGIINTWAETQGIHWEMRPASRFQELAPPKNNGLAQLSSIVPLNIAGALKERAQDLEISVSMFLRELVTTHVAELEKLWNEK